MTSLPEFRCVFRADAVLGEGPIWDPRIEKLLFVDIKGRKLFVYDPAHSAASELSSPSMISAIGLRRQGGYVCAHRDGFARLRIEGGEIDLTPIGDPENDRPGNRFNDGKVDPAGGFWAGTMDRKEKNKDAGSWWRLAPDNAIALIDKGFHVTNGPAFAPDGARVYFTDSGRQTIYVAEIVEGGFRNKRIFLTFGDGDGYPDGMEADSTGALWVAFWDGGAVRRFSPEGNLLAEMTVPAPRPTSVAFAGDRVFITSARTGLSNAQLEQFPLSGALFEAPVPRELSPPPRYFEG